MSHAAASQPETWTGGIPPGQLKPICAADVHPNFYPSVWRCFYCLYIDWVVPGQDSFFRPSEDTPFQPEQCTRCSRPRCLDCVYLDMYQSPLMTVGGKNLRKDWAQPAGWRCCKCMSTHAAQTHGGRPETHVEMHFQFGEQNIRGFLDHGCHRQTGGCGHPICPYCCVVNKYGEVLGTCGSESFQPVSYGLLYLHARWCHQHNREMLDVLGFHSAQYCGLNDGDPRRYEVGEGCMGCLKPVYQAGGDAEECQKAIGRIQQWVREFGMAVQGVRQRRGCER